MGFSALLVTAVVVVAVLAPHPPAASNDGRASSSFKLLEGDADHHVDYISVYCDTKRGNLIYFGGGSNSPAMSVVAGGCEKQ